MKVAPATRQADRAAGAGPLSQLARAGAPTSAPSPSIRLSAWCLMACAVTALSACGVQVPDTQRAAIGGQRSPAPAAPAVVPPARPSAATSAARLEAPPEPVVSAAVPLPAPLPLPLPSASSAEPITESDEPENRKRARIRLELASRYFENGQTTVALDEIKQSLTADPNYGPSYVLRGLVFMKLNNNRLAEESFQRALQINPGDPDALHNYGWYQCSVRRYNEAVALFTRALTIPTYAGQAKTYLAKGVCQTRAGQTAAAEASFARSYEIDPANPIAGFNLALLLFQRGDDRRAQFYVRRLNNSDLANAETLWLGIKVERRLSNQQTVQQLAQQLERRYPSSREWAAYQRGAFNE